MSYLADTNILLRWIEPGTPLCEQAQAAVKALRAAGETVVISPQNLVEFWNGATRPQERNGLGLTPQQADAELSKLEALFPIVPDTPLIHIRWRRLVVAAGVSGVQVHDARLAAVMMAHGISHILTFNDDDFRRFEKSAGIIVVHPRAVPEDAPSGNG